MPNPSGDGAMSGLGLRYCRQHPEMPLVLKQTTGALYWRCEHASGCAYTENALAPSRGAVAANGRALPGLRRRGGGKRAVRPWGGSVVERDVLERNP